MKLSLLGANGKMGRTLLQLNSAAQWVDQHPDLVLDFAAPEAVLTADSKFVAGIPFLVGSTGWTQQQLRSLVRISEQRPVMKIANFSRFLGSVQTWMQTLQALQPKASLLEIHHQHKKDAPSGTALWLQQALLPLPCPIESRREGEVFGIHRLELQLEDEVLVIEHKALDRKVFARGALYMAQRWLQWLNGASSGFYEPDQSDFRLCQKDDVLRNLEHGSATPQ